MIWNPVTLWIGIHFSAIHTYQFGAFIKLISLTSLLTCWRKHFLIRAWILMILNVVVPELHLNQKYFRLSSQRRALVRSKWIPKQIRFVRVILSVHKLCIAMRQDSHQDTVVVFVVQFRHCKTRAMMSQSISYQPRPSQLLANIFRLDELIR